MSVTGCSTDEAQRESFCGTKGVGVPATMVLSGCQREEDTIGGSGRGQRNSTASPRGSQVSSLLSAAQSAVPQPSAPPFRSLSHALAPILAHPPFIHPSSTPPILSCSYPYLLRITTTHKPAVAAWQFADSSEGPIEGSCWLVCLHTGGLARLASSVPRS